MDRRDDSLDGELQEMERSMTGQRKTKVEMQISLSQVV